MVIPPKQWHSGRQKYDPEIPSVCLYTACALAAAATAPPARFTTVTYSTRLQFLEHFFFLSTDYPCLTPPKCIRLWWTPDRGLNCPETVVQKTTASGSCHHLDFWYKQPPKKSRSCRPDRKMNPLHYLNPTNGSWSLQAAPSCSTATMDPLVGPLPHCRSYVVVMS